MAFQIERRAVIEAGLKHRREAFDQQLEAGLKDVGNGMAAQRRGNRREEKPMAPAMGRRADKPRHRDDAVLELADVMRQTDDADQRGLGLTLGNLSHIGRHEKRICPRRMVAGLRAGGIRGDRFAPQELQRLGARFVPQAPGLADGRRWRRFPACGSWPWPPAPRHTAWHRRRWPQRDRSSSQLASSQPSKPVSASQANHSSSGTLPNWPRTSPI